MPIDEDVHVGICCRTYPSVGCGGIWKNSISVGAGFGTNISAGSG